jgi:hypothetical protein
MVALADPKSKVYERDLGTLVIKLGYPLGIIASLIPVKKEYDSKLNR